MATGDHKIDAASVARKIRSGESLKQIATRLGATYNAVYRAAKRGGIAFAGRHATKLTPAMRRAMTRKYLAGHDAQSLAQAYDVTANTVYYHLRQAGVPRIGHGRHCYTDADDRAIKRAVASVAKKLGLPERSIASRVSTIYYGRGKTIK